GGEVTLLDALRELDLLRSGEQRVAAGLVQEHLEGIGGVQAGADAEVELELLFLGLRGCAVVLELEGQGLRLDLVEIVGENGLGHVGRGDRPVLGAQVKERLQGVVHRSGHGDVGQRTPYSVSYVSSREAARAVCASAVIVINALVPGVIPRPAWRNRELSDRLLLTC